MLAAGTWLTLRPDHQKRDTAPSSSRASIVAVRGFPLTSGRVEWTVDPTDLIRRFLGASPP